MYYLYICTYLSLNKILIQYCLNTFSLKFNLNCKNRLHHTTLINNLLYFKSPCNIYLCMFKLNFIYFHTQINVRVSKFYNNNKQNNLHWYQVIKIYNKISERHTYTLWLSQAYYGLCLYSCTNIYLLFEFLLSSIIILNSFIVACSGFSRLDRRG